LSKVGITSGRAFSQIPVSGSCQISDVSTLPASSVSTIGSFSSTAAKRPRLDDIRWAAEAEDAADALIFLYRHAYYLAIEAKGEVDEHRRFQLLNKAEEIRNLAELIVAKNRHGPTGTIHAFCDLAVNRFAGSADELVVTDRASAVETIAGTTYTQIAADATKWKRTTNASAVTITIDANVNAAGNEITFSQGGAGQITFVAGAGLTLSSRGAALKSAGQYAVCGVKFISATEATLFGDITA
jgi:DnaB-like helicase C terminal domain